MPATLLYSSRSFEDIIYREELERLAVANDGLKIVHTLTRKQPAGWTRRRAPHRPRHAGKRGFSAAMKPRIFICGPTQLVESASQIMLDLGHDRTLIKTERFGPTGG